MADRKQERFRVVPIERDARIAQDIDGEQYYRQRGDTVISEVEIVSEVPFESEAGSTVIPKSDDVQQADYQVENPPQEEEEIYDAPDGYEDASDYDAYDYGNYDDYEHYEEEPVRRSKRAASRPAAKPWYKKIWLYLLLAGVMLVTGGILYLRGSKNYAAELAQIEKQVTEITKERYK